MANKRRVALVTGGAKRVGRAIVEKLAASGFEVGFTFYTSAAEATELCRLLHREEQRVIAIPANLSLPGQTDFVGETMERLFGRVDVLVNNASLYRATPFNKPEPDLARQMFDIHFHEPLALCRRFADALRASRGHIVNIVDLLAEKPWPEFLAYCASKAALANLTLSLARELAPEVTANGIAPGVADWPEDFPEEQKKKYLARVPLARPGTPEDVAGLVQYLCTTGSYITGQIIRLDGGRSIT